MGAAQFVGRVGGLAVALGVGAAVFSGAGVASADTSGARGDSGNASDSSARGGESSSQSTPSRGSKGAASTSGATEADDSTAEVGGDEAAPDDIDIPSDLAEVVRGNETDNNRGPDVDATAIGDDATGEGNGKAPAEIESPADAGDNGDPIRYVAPGDPTVQRSVELAVENAPAEEPVGYAELPTEWTLNPVEDVVPEVVDVPVAYDGPLSFVVEDGPLDEPKVIVDPVVEEPDTAIPGEVTDVVMYATGGPSDGADSDPTGPVDSSLTDLILASFVRREVLSSSATDSPAAQVTASAPLTAAPVTTYFDGVLQGNLHVTSASGCGSLGSTCKLVYSFVGSSDGGKVTLDKVPAALPEGGAGSYTFLPYATWINPANPVEKPTPTGIQDFTVRISENTKFNQTITSIPLIGLFAEPIIKLMQQTPFIGNLLAPLIGASITQTVSVDVGNLVTAGKQVAYTYFVNSFDGTPISMNYFPASTPSLVLPGQQQATIFNGPGLGSPGESNPYALLNAGGSTPPVATMRGQGLPDPFGSLPLGFNVITWDPRGEWASGGVLQLDNPFYEGRDVSALIDWADANTPLLNEDGDPAIAMLGGSYGGGIQMTTVDPRIDAVVPAIAWNSLNESLYPNNVFKTGWANVLASALLLPLGNSASGLNRVNSQITQALLTGNLFGFISESGQAVLSSSGPTSLLTKLDIPTMYVQGIIDALFPLQQAVQNAQTQLEQNPFFAGDNADLVKMIWFCGGHGICTTQTPAQQTEQNTLIFLENLVWANFYAKEYLQQGPFKPVGEQLAQFIGATAPMQWWDQKGAPWVALDMPWTSAFQGDPVTGGNLEGGRINSFTSRTGALTEQDPAAQIGCAITASACKWPLNQVFATEAKNAVEVLIPIPVSTDVDGNPDLFIVGAPTVSFSYSGVGNAKAVYAQIVDNATGQVLGNIDTPIPVTLDGKDHTVVDFAIANIAYSNPVKGQAATSLTLQIVGNSSLYANNAVIWSVDISDLSVSLPTGDTVFKNPLAELF
jgi:ABC-2 type transport system ATP-binding protein